MRIATIRAVAAGDHQVLTAIKETGYDPIHIIEFCIEMRGNAIDTLMRHVVYSECNLERIRDVISHLSMIDRYYHASDVLTGWMSEFTETRLVHELPSLSQP